MIFKSKDSTATKIKEFCCRHVEKTDLAIFNIIDSAFYNNCGFYLVQHPLNDSTEYQNWLDGSPSLYGKKEILTISTQNQKSTELGIRKWAYSICREGENLNFLSCPKRMLDLSENTDDDAIKWRKKCYEKHQLKNEHRTTLRKKIKLIGELTKGLIIETNMYGSIIFEQCFEGERNVLIGYLVKSPISRLQFQISLISISELESALIKNAKAPTSNKVKSRNKKCESSNRLLIA